MSIKERGHASNVHNEECPLLTLKPRGHASNVHNEECPLLTLKPMGHASNVHNGECPLLELKRNGNGEKVVRANRYTDCSRSFNEEYSHLTLDWNTMYIDLHTHSTASDGSMTPAELVRHAHDRGLAAVAITDHDTVNGAGQALEEGFRLGIEVIAGVEISVDFEPEMHLLGYFPDGDFSAIRKTLAELIKKREERNPRIVSKLNELGFDITLSEAKRLALGGNVGRPHIARVMVDKGYAASIDEVFDKYLASGRPAYFKKDKLTPAEGIVEITRAGGIPVLAHPIHLGMTGGRLDRLLGELAGAGLMGIEAYYSENTAEQTTELLQLALRHKLLVTGGSDFHGRFKPDIEIGIGKGSLKVPYKLLSVLKNSRMTPC